MDFEDYFSGRSVVLFLSVLPLLYVIGKGYSFFLDQLFGPGRIDSGLYGFTSFKAGESVLFLLMDKVQFLFVAPLVQDLMLTGVVLGTSLLAYRYLDDGKKIYAGLFVLFNPFFYARFVSGQWLVVWGLMLLPLVFKSFTEYLEDRNTKNLLFFVFVMTLLSASAHILFASSVLLGSILLFKLLRDRNVRDVEVSYRSLALFVPLNAFWIIPLLLKGSSRISEIGASHLYAFAPDGTVFNAMYSMASMHGFWRQGYVYAKDIVPWTQWLFIPILFFSVHGFMKYKDDESIGYVVKGLGLTWVIALLLGVSVSGPFPEFMEWLYLNVPFLKGMRDSQKFVALIVLVYAYLGGLGVKDIIESVRNYVEGRDLDYSFEVRDRVFAAVDVVPKLVLGLILVIPLVYTFPMLTGFAGQIQPQDYPDEWYEVKEKVDTGQQDYNLLFLPWHQYMDMSWLNQSRKRIANPSEAFFEKSVFRGENAEVGGVYSSSGKPSSRFIRFMFGLGGYEDKNVTNLGEHLTHLDVKYVLVTKETNWQGYDNFLKNQSDLELVLNNSKFNVYENQYEVSKAYSVDRKVYVSNWTQYLERSRSEDTTESVYVINKSRAGEVERLGDAGRESVNISEVNPATYGITEKPENSLTVFTQRQDNSFDNWRLNGKQEEGLHLGLAPVFDSEKGTLRYERFYRVYLPSYLVSLVTFMVLVYLYFRPERVKEFKSKVLNLYHE